MHREKAIWFAALHSCGCTQRDLKMLMRMQDFLPKNLWEDWDQITTEWIPSERRAKIDARVKIFDIKKIQKTIEQCSIEIVSEADPEYPEGLRHIGQSPAILYVRGQLRETALMFGVVGSRSHTSYGSNILSLIIRDLSTYDVTIISGGAHGIDTAAHTLALEHNLPTIVVFGSGIDVFYPSNNRTLFDKILAENGALISHFPIGTRPEPYMFPMRNEIVSGISHGIIIPEAGEKSGTLITARLALEQGKDVFAVPGDVFRETSRGCNLLIAKGEAKCIISAEDILSEYLVDNNASNMTLPIEERVFSTEKGSEIFSLIIAGQDTPESILQSTDLSPDILMMELSLLEIDGHIFLEKDGKYSPKY